MPFDFNFAMDVLEALSEDERAMVLQSAAGILGPMTAKVGGKMVMACWWAKSLNDVHVELASEVNFDDVTSYRGSFRERVVRASPRIYEVRFKCAEIYGIQLSPLTKEQQKGTEAGASSNCS